MYGLAGVSALISQPVFQAGAKYWLVLSLMLVATLLSLHYDPALVSLNPAFGYVAASLAMSERVEATVSKVKPAGCAMRFSVPHRLRIVFASWPICSWLLLLPESAYRRPQSPT
jgi:hypothetical protein